MKRLLVIIPPKEGGKINLSEYKAQIDILKEHFGACTKGFSAMGIIVEMRMPDLVEKSFLDEMGIKLVEWH